MIEHVARLGRAESYYREQDKLGKGIHLVSGPDGAPTSVRFDAALFTAEAANAWLAEHEYDVEVEPPEEHTGVMVAFKLPGDLHLTLAYLGRIDEQPDKALALSDLVARFAQSEQPFEATLNGVGYFEAGESGLYPVYANFDAPELSAFRQRLVEVLENSGFTVSAEHGFSPHVTLDYVLDPTTLPVLEPATYRIDQVTLYWGGITVSLDLKGGNMPYDVRQEGDKWCLYREGNPKPLGCHGTKSDAERQMRAVLAATHTKFMVGIEAMKKICPSCADLLAGLGAEQVNLDHLLKAVGVGGDFPGGMPPQLAEGLCKKIGSDPGFFTTCMATPLSLPDGWDKSAFCAELHKYCVGIWPGEHKELEPGESYTHEERLVRDAWYDTFEPDVRPRAPGYVKEVFPDKVLVEGNDGNLYFYPYVEDEVGIVFGEPYQVEVEYIPVPMAGVAMALWKTLKNKSRFAVWEKDGVSWYAAIVSSTFKDDEEEVVAGEGMDFSIKLAEKYGYHSKLYLHHEVPETWIGTCQREMRIGPFWLEIGTFRDHWLARRVFEVLQKDAEGKWKVSIGFLTPVVQKKRGVYTVLLKFDSSITDAPANPWTAIAVGGKSMDVERIMRLLNPTDEKEKENFSGLLEELFAASKATTVVVKDLSAVVEGLRGMREGASPEEQVKIDQAIAALEGTPVVEEEAPEDALKMLQDALNKLLERVTALEGAMVEGKEQRELLTALLRRVPNTPRPTAQAEPVDNVEQALAKMGTSKTQHPLSGMMGAPGGNK